MTKEQIKKLAESIVTGTATEAEIIQYNQICDLAETTNNEAVSISLEEKEELESTLKKAIFHKAGLQKVHQTRWLNWTAVAASVVFIIVAGSIIFFNKKHDTISAFRKESKTDSLRFIARLEVNTTGKDRRIQLSDGSLVVLANKSEIRYSEPFTERRDITLVGKAYFAVAKNKAAHFTVFSGDISTTALGTKFTVTAVRNSSQIIVRLYEGQVVVKSVFKGNKSLQKDFYLFPGEAFVYGSQTVGKLKGIKVKKTSAPEQILHEEIARDNPSLPENTGSPYFMFNNRPLEEVLDNLAGLFDVKIIYNRREVQNIYLIGKYNNEDSIDRILRRIATLNRLTVRKKDNAFIISKLTSNSLKY